MLLIHSSFPLLTDICVVSKLGAVRNKAAMKIAISFFVVVGQRHSFLFHVYLREECLGDKVGISLAAVDNFVGRYSTSFILLQDIPPGSWDEGQLSALLGNGCSWRVLFLQLIPVATWGTRYDQVTKSKGAQVHRWVGLDVHACVRVC